MKTAPGEGRGGEGRGDGERHPKNAAAHHPEQSWALEVIFKFHMIPKNDIIFIFVFSI